MSNLNQNLANNRVKDLVQLIEEMLWPIRQATK